MSLHIKVDTIPHKKQRYETLGDYYPSKNLLGKGTDYVRISNLNNRKYEFLIAIHELVEMFLCQERNIKETDISKFDIEFEKKRKKGDIREPGDQKEAPYYKEHQFATKIEKQLAKELKIKWSKYEQDLLNL